MIPHNDPFSKCRKLLCLMPQAINFNFVGFFNNNLNQGDIILHSEKRNLIPFSWNKEGQVTLSNYVTWEFDFAFHIKHSLTWNVTVSLKTAEELCSTTNRNFIFLIKGTFLWDRFRKCWWKLMDLGLNKGRGRFLNFSKAPLIFSLNKTSPFR